MGAITKLSVELGALKEKVAEFDAWIRGGVSRAHPLLCDAYHDFGASTAPFDEEGTGVGNRFIGWFEEELDSL